MGESASKWQPDLAELEKVRRDASELVKETPIFTMAALAHRTGGRIAVKAENLQRTGSFKLRGALAKLSAGSDEGLRGVVAGSAGNHGQALAYAARTRNIPCTVFMPLSAPVSKVQAVSAFGGTVMQLSDSVDGCIDAARQLAGERGLLFFHPFDDLEIVKGQAGLGLELAEQAPDLAQVIVPVGGGGLIGGIAAALRIKKPNVRVVGVQASGCASFSASLEAGHPQTVAESSTIADGISIKRPGEVTLALANRWVDEMVTVDDDAIAEAMVLVAERGKLVVEGAGAVAVAALLTEAVTPTRPGTTVAVLSGGNVDANIFAAVINRHQTGIGRRVRLFTRIADRPGALADLLRVVAEAGGNVLDLTHVRDGVPLQVEETGVEVVVESRNQHHRAELIERVGRAGYFVQALI
jgi:threonine dehydratase